MVSFKFTLAWYLNNIVLNSRHSFNKMTMPSFNFKSEFHCVIVFGDDGITLPYFSLHLNKVFNHIKMVVNDDNAALMPLDVRNKCWIFGYSRLVNSTSGNCIKFTQP